MSALPKSLPVSMELIFNVALKVEMNSSESSLMNKYRNKIAQKRCTSSKKANHVIWLNSLFILKFSL